MHTNNDEDASLVATAPIVHALVAATDDMVVQKRRLEDPFDGNNEPAMKKAAVSKASASNTADTPATPAAVPAASKAASEREEGNRLATELDEKGITEKAAFDALTFPEKLIFLLQNEVVPDALWWEKDGLSFGFQPGNFTEKVLKNLFPIRIKFESFIRKLNRWGFRRVFSQSLPAGTVVYRHPDFQREKPEMTKRIRFCQKGAVAEARKANATADAVNPTAGSLLQHRSLLDRHADPSLASFDCAQRQLDFVQSATIHSSRQPQSQNISITPLLNHQVGPRVIGSSLTGGIRLNTDAILHSNVFLRNSCLFGSALPSSISAITQNYQQQRPSQREDALSSSTISLWAQQRLRSNKLLAGAKCHSFDTLIAAAAGGGGEGGAISSREAFIASNRPLSNNNSAANFQSMREILNQPSAATPLDVFAQRLARVAPLFAQPQLANPFRLIHQHQQQQQYQQMQQEQQKESSNSLLFLEYARLQHQNTVNPTKKPPS